MCVHMNVCMGMNHTFLNSFIISFLGKNIRSIIISFFRTLSALCKGKHFHFHFHFLGAADGKATRKVLQFLYIFSYVLLSFYKSLHSHFHFTFKTLLIMGYTERIGVVRERRKREKKDKTKGR